jgi:hypothetical protein
MNDKSTLVLRTLLGRRFNILAYLIKEDDIGTFMSYMNMGDLADLSEEEMKVFIAKGRETGMFFARSR